MHLESREACDQPAVDSAEAQFAGIGPVACARHMVKNPFDLGGTEICVNNQAGLLADHVGIARFAKRVTVFRSASVLPDYGVVNRLAGVGIPHNRGLALVGNADGGDILAVDSDLGDSFGYDRCLGSPDLVRVMFHPSRLREDLGKLMLGH